MKRISFEEFFVACRDKLSGAELKTLNPAGNSYWKCDGAYLGCSYFEESHAVWVSVVCGSGLGWVRELVEKCKTEGIFYLACYCHEDNKPVMAITKYLHSKSQSVGDGWWAHQVFLHDRRLK